MATHTMKLENPSIADQMFSDLSPTLSQALEDAAFTTTYHSGSVLFAEGQSPRGIFLLRHGRVKLSVRNREGKLSILRIAHAGEILGMSEAVSAAVSDRSHEATAETHGTCEVSFIRQSDFQRLMRVHPELTRWVAQQLSYDYDVVGPHFLRLNAVVDNFTFC